MAITGASNFTYSRTSGDNCAIAVNEARYRNPVAATPMTRMALIPVCKICLVREASAVTLVSKVSGVNVFGLFRHDHPFVREKRVSSIILVVPKRHLGQPSFYQGTLEK